MPIERTKPKAVEEEAAPPRNLYQRMLWVTGALPRIAKDSTVQTGGGGSFKAVSHDAVVGALKPLLVEAGIAVLQTVEEHKHEALSWKDRDGHERTAHWHEVKLKLTFVNVDQPDEQIEVVAYGAALDRQDKGLGKAVSYAKKYGLLTNFLCETGEDTDTANGAGTGTGPRSADSLSAPQPTVDQRPHPLAADIPAEAWREIVAAWHDGGTISEKQVKRLFAIAVNDGGWKGDDVSEIVKHHLGVDVTQVPWGKPYDKLVALFQTFGPQSGKQEQAEGQRQEHPPSDDDIPF